MFEFDPKDVPTLGQQFQTISDSWSSQSFRRGFLTGMFTSAVAAVGIGLGIAYSADFSDAPELMQQSEMVLSAAIASISMMLGSSITSVTAILAHCVNGAEPDPDAKQDTFLDGMMFGYLPQFYTGAAVATVAVAASAATSIFSPS